MPTERNPVPGSDPPERLDCKDFDAATGKRIGHACQDEQLVAIEAWNKENSGKPKKDRASQRFDCTGHRTTCNRRTFLYPRKVNAKGNFHTHQGIDFFPKETKKKPDEPAPEVEILSVTGGDVCQVLTWDGASSGYGNVIAVYDSSRDMTFWYAHCARTLLKKGEPVREGQPIAIVGNTGRAGGPHLHFEVYSGRCEHSPGKESTIFDPPPALAPLPAKGKRLDPFDVLLSLGPWGMTQTFDPSGVKIDADRVLALHTEIESSREGGCFPLGANNLWHGGIHLRMPPGGELHAPFDGEIVAVRLDADPTIATGPHGSTNFVLLRHTIGETVLARLQSIKDPGALPPPPRKPPAVPAVGRRCTNEPADVGAVMRALHDRGFYEPADPSVIEHGEPVDDALIAAIEAFQRTLPNPYESSNKRWPDGKITVGGLTWRELFPPAPPSEDDPTTPEQPPPPPVSPIDPKRIVYSLFMHVGAVPLDAAQAKRVPWLAKAASDPTLLAKLEARGPDGRAKVVAGLSIPVAGNDVLWVAGRGRVAKADDTVSLESLVHWEIFAQEQLVAAWEADALRDTNDDLTLDVPERIFEAVELTTLPGFAADDFITPFEMMEFYASERAAFLRRTPCLFRSEWGMNLAVAIPKIAEMGIDTSGLETELRPLLWWDEAADVLPPSPLVWHYNPIEFLGLYQAHLDALSPAAIDPATTATLVVRVLFDNGVRRAKAGVFVSRGGSQIDARRTVDDGEARFGGLEPGDVDVSVDGSTIAVHRALLTAGATTVLEVSTMIPGPPPPRGTITITVRRHDGFHAGPGLVVELVAKDGGAAVSEVTNGSGKVLFASQRFGEYSVKTRDAEPVAVGLDKKKKSETITLPRPNNAVIVALSLGKDPAVGYEIEVLSKDTAPFAAITDDAGEARFELPVGRYKAHVGEHQRSIRVDEREVLRYGIKLSPKDPVAPKDGTLVVQAWAGDEAAQDVYVAVLELDGAFVQSGHTELDGTATFELPPGEYAIDVAEQSLRDRVDASRITTVEVEISVEISVEIDP